MIYGVRLGSLGNQMHIVAATYATALDMQTPWAVSKDTNEGYNGLIPRSSFNETFFKHLVKKDLPRTNRTFSEGTFKYRPIPRHKDLTLKGYFQSDKYYGHRKSQIVDLFYSYYPQVEDKVMSWFSGIEQNKTISLHVRRTDYVQLAKIHQVQPLQYYQHGLESIATKLDVSLDRLKQTYRILVFSDDLAWCKESAFFKDYQVTFVENKESDELNAIIDLYTMAQCAHHVIANSSFSWWGAYLNRREDKLVVAPKQWFGPRGPKTWKDVYTENMILC